MVIDNTKKVNTTFGQKLAGGIIAAGNLGEKIFGPEGISSIPGRVVGGVGKFFGGMVDEGISDITGRPQGDLGATIGEVGGTLGGSLLSGNIVSKAVSGTTKGLSNALKSVDTIRDVTDTIKSAQEGNLGGTLLGGANVILDALGFAGKSKEKILSNINKINKGKTKIQAKAELVMPPKGTKSDKIGGAINELLEDWKGDTTKQFTSRKELQKVLQNDLNGLKNTEDEILKSVDIRISKDEVEEAAKNAVLGISTNPDMKAFPVKNMTQDYEKFIELSNKLKTAKSKKAIDAIKKEQAFYKKGYQFVQDQIDEMTSRLAGQSSYNINKIIGNQADAVYGSKDTSDIQQNFQKTFYNNLNHTVTSKISEFNKDYGTIRSKVSNRTLLLDTVKDKAIAGDITKRNLASTEALEPTDILASRQNFFKSTKDKLFGPQTDRQAKALSRALQGQPSGVIERTRAALAPAEQFNVSSLQQTETGKETNVYEGDTYTPAPTAMETLSNYKDADVSWMYAD